MMLSTLSEYQRKIGFKSIVVNTFAENEKHICVVAVQNHGNATFSRGIMRFNEALVQPIHG